MNKAKRINELGNECLEKNFVPFDKTAEGYLPQDMVTMYEKGYLQAEKDLALIPEDMGVIFNLVWRLQTAHVPAPECYAEALKLFNEARNDKRAED